MNESEELQKDCEEMLLHQYRVAIVLYIHEDNLNWNKVNNMFYLNAGLLAILTFLAGDGISIPNGAKGIAFLATCIFGMIITFGFTLAIRSGVKYMMARKEKVVELEHIMVRQNGIYIVHNPHLTKKNDLLTVSPTTIVLKFIPKLFAISWVALVIYSGSQILL